MAVLSSLSLYLTVEKNLSLLSWQEHNLDLLCQVWAVLPGVQEANPRTESRYLFQVCIELGTRWQIHTSSTASVYQLLAFVHFQQGRINISHTCNKLKLQAMAAASFFSVSLYWLRKSSSILLCIPYGEGVYVRWGLLQVRISLY